MHKFDEIKSPRLSLLLFWGVALYSLFIAVFVFHIEAFSLAPFAGADAETFRYGGQFLYSELGPFWSVANYDDLILKLAEFRYTPKYWGFAYLNYIAFSFFPDSPLQQSIFLKFWGACCWLFFVLHAYSRILRHERHGLSVAFLFLFLGLFPALINYRDVYIGVLLYFLTYFFFFKKSIVFSAAILLLLSVFRVEFVAPALLGLCLIFTMYSVFKSRKWLLFIVGFSLPFFVFLFLFLHKFQLENLQFLPLSFLGVNGFSSLFLYLTGDHPIQGRLVNFVAFEIYVFLRPITLYCLLLGLFVVIQDKRRDMSFMFAIYMFSFFWVTYTIYHAGFQPRVNASVLPLMAFAPWHKLKLYRSVIVVFLMVFSVVFVRNMRWLY